MPTLISTVVVQRPQQDVFDYLTDISRHEEWSPKPWRLESIKPTLQKGLNNFKQRLESPGSTSASA